MYISDQKNIRSTYTDCFENPASGHRRHGSTSIILYRHVRVPRNSTFFDIFVMRFVQMRGEIILLHRGWGALNT